MKTMLALLLLMSMAPAIQANAEKDPHHDQQVDAIAGLKDRLKTLRDYIDRLNSNTCQSGTSATSICDANDEFRKLFKCLTSDSPINKRATLDFSRKFEAPPVVVAGITGLSGYAANVQLSADDVETDSFQLHIKSEDLFAPFGVSSGYFSCPHGLHAGHSH